MMQLAADYYFYDVFGYCASDADRGADGGKGGGADDLYLVCCGLNARRRFTCCFGAIINTWACQNPR